MGKENPTVEERELEGGDYKTKKNFSNSLFLHLFTFLLLFSFSPNIVCLIVCVVCLLCVIQLHLHKGIISIKFWSFMSQV